MIEIALLATTVVSKFLVPLFTKSKDDFSDDVAGTVGRAASDGLTKTAGKIWNRIIGRFSQDNEKSAVNLFKEDPENMEKMMIKLLQKRLDDDSDFRDQIQQLVEEPVPGTGRTSWQLIGDYVGAVDARNAAISGNATVAGLIVKSAESSGSPQKGDASKS